MKGINNISSKKGFIITALSASSCVVTFAGSSCRPDKEISYEKMSDKNFLTAQDVKGNESFELSTINTAIGGAIDSSANLEALNNSLKGVKGIKDFVYSYYKEESAYYKSTDEATPKNTKKGVAVLVIKGKKDGEVTAKTITGTKEDKGNTTATTKSK